MTESLYNKYRPKNLDEVVGQENAVKQLRTFFDTDTVPQAILFAGPPGTGKTSLARIVKNELGCGDIDFKELNAADFRGIDTVRELRRMVSFKPMAGKSSVFLLDEVAKMSNDGQTAMLKLLEDPPSHVYFLLCTTDPHKLIPTLRGRCATISLSSLTPQELGVCVNRVVKAEGAKVSEGVVSKIVKASDGSARVAVVKLQQVIKHDEGDQEELVSYDPERLSIDVCRILIGGRGWKEMVEVLNAIDKKEDCEQLRHAVLGYCKSVLCGGNVRSHLRALEVMEVFQFNLFDYKWPGFYANCYKLLRK